MARSNRWYTPSHKEVQVRRRDEGRYQPYQVVVHVGGVAEGGRGHRHDGGHQGIELRERGLRDVQPLCGN